MRSNWMKMDKWLLFWTFFMFILGLFMIFSASSVEASLMGSPYHYFIKQSLTLIMCVVAFFIVTSIPLNVYKKLAFLFVIGVIASLVGVYLYGAIINQARSWIPLGFYNFQPSEFAKTALILYMAVYYSKHKDSDNLIVILTPIFAAIAMCALTFVQPDLGTSVIIMIIAATIFFSIPFDKNIRKIFIQLTALIISIVLLYGMVTNFSFLREGQKDRFDYHNPCSKYLSGGSGYQVCNGFIAINHGGLWGVGLGNSTQKYLYLPEAHTDFIYAVIVEELGMVTGVGILLIYAIILISIMRIAFRSKSIMGSVIAYGAATYLFLHVFINLVGVLGLLPLTGVPLPFLSYGGSFALNLSILLALVQRVEVENKKKIQEKMLKEGKTH